MGVEFESLPTDNPQLWTADDTAAAVKDIKGRMYKWEGKPGLFRKFCCFEICGLSYLAQAVLSATCTGSFIFGLNLSLLNTSMHTIGADFNWCVAEGYVGCDEFRWKSAFVQTGVFIGAACGSIIGGRFLTYGCRTVFNATMAVLAVGICFSCAAQDFPVLLMARLVVGFGVGTLAVAVPTYIAEITPPAKRGAYGVMHQLMICTGILVGVLLGLPLSQQPVAAEWVNGPTASMLKWKVPKFDKIWWRIMLGFGALPILLALYVFNVAYHFDTPYFLLLKGDRKQEARALLRKLTDKEDVEAELGEIQAQVESAEVAKKSGVGLKSLMTDRAAAYVVFVGCMISAFQQLVGINVFVTSSNKLFADAGLSTDLVTTMSTVLTVVNLVMTFPAIWAIEALGRRTLLLIGIVGMGGSVVPGAIMLWVNEESNATSWVAIAGAICFIVFFSATYGPVLWVYLFEIYPAEIKDLASGLATGVNWIAGIVMVFAASFMHTKVAYTLFVGFCAVGFVFVFFTMKETKGRVVGDSPYFPSRRQDSHTETLELGEVAAHSHEEEDVRRRRQMATSEAVTLKSA